MTQALEREPGNHAHQYHPTVLREYDIRGIVGDTLSEDDARATGRALGTVIRRQGGKTAVVGYDGRHSSPGLAAAMREGLASTGLDVTDVGRGPSPMTYYAVKALETDGGVMITGSHNPPEYNGFKMVLQSGPVYGDAITDLGRIAAGGDFETGEGKITSEDIRERYVERLLKDLVPGRDLKVAWDCGNGATGEIMQMLAKRMPGEHYLLFDDIDGDFPNHHPDPTVDANLADLQKLVAEKGCDLGLAFDGDGDRIGAVDENGNVLWCDILMAIYARDVLERHPGATIIADVKSSQVLFDEIKRLGGKPLMWNTGHSLIKAKMIETRSPLSGELAGHIFFADGWYGFDDAIYCGIRLMNEVLRSGQKLSQLYAHLPKLHNTPETRFQVDESRKFAIVGEILARMKEQEGAGLAVNDIDGVRVTTEEGWWLVRASNTQDVLTARVEAYTEDALQKLIDQLSGQLELSGVESPFKT